MVTIEENSVLSDVNYGLNGEEVKNTDTTLADWGANTLMDSLPKPGYNVMQYIFDHIIYPADLNFDTDDRVDTTIAGLVTTRFVIMEDGAVRMAYTVPKGASSLEEEVLRVISTMPKWESAAIKDQKRVKYLVTLPINFNLSFHQGSRYQYDPMPSYRPERSIGHYQNGRTMYTYYSYY